MSQPFLFREIEDGELAAVLLCRPVVRLRGFDFVGIHTEPPTMSAYLQGDAPFFFLFIPINTGKACDARLPGDLAVPDILFLRGRAEICLAIIERISIDMIDEHPLGHRTNQIMHTDRHLPGAFAGLVQDRAFGVAGTRAVPFMLVEALEIVRIDDGVFSAGQFDPAKGVAVPHSAGHEHDPDRDADQNRRGCQRKRYLYGRQVH